MKKGNYCGNCKYSKKFMWLFQGLAKCSHKNPRPNHAWLGNTNFGSGELEFRFCAVINKDGECEGFESKAKGFEKWFRYGE
ncbi:MAG: hypothetical protein GY737_00070 [Desulfobacteraceae bacterium]|nr:hypothetical protein [Desulfobacteraceae bacterium]